MSGAIGSYFDVIPVELLVRMMIPLKLKDRLHLAKAYPHLSRIAKDSILKTRLVTCSESALSRAEMETILDFDGTKVEFSLDFTKDTEKKTRLAISTIELMPKLEKVTLKGCTFVPILWLECGWCDPSKPCCTNCLSHSFWTALLKRAHTIVFDDECRFAYNELEMTLAWNCMIGLFRDHLFSNDSNLSNLDLGSIFPTVLMTTLAKSLRAVSDTPSTQGILNTKDSIKVSVLSGEGLVMDLNSIICAVDSKWDWMREAIVFHAILKTTYYKMSNVPWLPSMSMTHDSVKVSMDKSKVAHITIGHNFPMASFKKKLDDAYDMFGRGLPGPPPSRFY